MNNPDEWCPVEAAVEFSQAATFCCPITFGPIEYDEEDVLNSWWLDDAPTDTEKPTTGAWIGTAGISGQR